jgi:hypothetical protein
MKTVTVSGRSRDIKRLLELAKTEDVIVRTPGGEEFMLSQVDDFEYEVIRQRRNKKLMAFLDQRFEEARSEKGIPLKDVYRRLGIEPSSEKKQARRTKTT